MVDNLGVTWLQWKNRLFRCVPGICVPVFGESEITPFSVRRQLRDVFIDRAGNAFLETAGGSLGWFMIFPQSPPPRPSIKVEATGPDSVQISMDANSPAKVRFRWQLDQGPEQTTQEPVLNLTSLPNGIHQFNLTVVDDQLQMATAKPVKFKTSIDANLQMARLIAELSSPDYEQRKAAVMALALQPATAVPALNKSRIKADEATQWWIAAALQEIENRQGKTDARNH